nr:hypothetical protein [Candidatus Sigynarchaeota archaeon]
MRRDDAKTINEKVLKKQLIEARIADVHKELEYNVDEESVRQNSFKLSEFNHGFGLDDFQKFLTMHANPMDAANADMLEYLRDFLIFCTGNGMYGRIRPYALLHVFYLNQDKIAGLAKSPKFPLAGNKIQAFLEALLLPVPGTRLIGIWNELQMLSQLRHEIAKDELTSIKEMIKAADSEFHTKEFTEYCWKQDWDVKIKRTKMLDKKYEFCGYFKGIKAKNHVDVKFNEIKDFFTVPSP